MTKANIAGAGAVLLWSLLAILTVKAAPVPPLLLSAIAFSIGGTIGLIWGGWHGLAKLKSVPRSVWAMGILGLFGYHFTYFSALRAAPAAQAGLIAYLWPLFIVLFSGFLPHEQLKRMHIVGALLAFGGAALLVSGGSRGFDTQFAFGYGLAFLCALIWSGYSVLSRLAKSAPTQSVAVFCLASAILSAIAHFFFEETVWPQDTSQWFACIALGLGPVGLAFYLWDIGVKQGNIQLLGVISYAAPLLSTLILVVFGIAEPSIILLASAVLIAGGAFLAARASKSR